MTTAYLRKALSPFCVPLVCQYEAIAAPRCCTYIPSCSARLEMRETGVERPELAGETARRPAVASRLIFNRRSVDQGGSGTA